MKKKKKRNISTTRKILCSFLLAILIGSILLSLPICSATGQRVPYIDALFTATTSICVTGLVTVPTYSTWSFWGQLIILILIQIGGLGVITIMSAIMIHLHKKMGLTDRMLIQDAFNLSSLSGLVKFVKNVLKGTFLIESIGALLYMIVLVPAFGIRGVWLSVFNAISAFCNAGMDIIGANSLTDFATSPIINFTTSFLVITGGIGFIVWWDLLRVIKKFKTHKFHCFKFLTLHSKIAISATFILLFGGGFLFLLFEYNNPMTLASYSFFDKLQLAFFQSMTTRTAGFFTLPQENLTNASSFTALLLMFIGGSPVGTAGGIKTVTLAVILAASISTVRQSESVSLFHRNIPTGAVSKSIAVLCTSFVIAFASTLLLSVAVNADSLSIVYESVSATATVGLSKNLTAYLNTWGKIIIIMTMYLGRVGPISLAIALNVQKSTQNIIKNPTEEISVG